MCLLNSAAGRLMSKYEVLPGMYAKDHLFLRVALFFPLASQTRYLLHGVYLVHKHGVWGLAPTANARMPVALGGDEKTTQN